MINAEQVGFYNLQEEAKMLKEMRQFKKLYYSLSEPEQDRIDSYIESNYNFTLASAVNNPAIVELNTRAYVSTVSSEMKAFVEFKNSLFENSYFLCFNSENERQPQFQTFKIVHDKLMEVHSAFNLPPLPDIKIDPNDKEYFFPLDDPYLSESPADNMLNANANNATNNERALLPLDLHALESDSLDDLVARLSNIYQPTIPEEMASIDPDMKLDEPFNNPRGSGMQPF